jgi:predicted hydrocarbon binding protein
MLNNTLLLKVKQRLNKLDSQDYDNLECWVILEAFNKAQIEWCRRQIIGRNITQEGSEQTIRKIDDLENLLTPVPLTFVSTSDYILTEPVPTDYLEFVKVDITASSNCCNTPKKMLVYLVEESNVSVILRDELKKPNFEWAETVATIVGGKLRIYTNGDFSINSVTLMYFRKPVHVTKIDCADAYTGLLSQTETICEFRDDIVEILIDATVSILAADIESFNQHQRASQASETNT